MHKQDCKQTITTWTFQNYADHIHIPSLWNSVIPALLYCLFIMRAACPNFPSPFRHNKTNHFSILKSRAHAKRPKTQLSLRHWILDSTLTEIGILPSDTYCVAVTTAQIICPHFCRRSFIQLEMVELVKFLYCYREKTVLPVKISHAYMKKTGEKRSTLNIQGGWGKHRTICRQRPNLSLTFQQAWDGGGG